MTCRTCTAPDRAQIPFLNTAMLAVFLVAANPASPLMAQGTQSEEAIEAIVDAPIATGERPVAEMESRIADAVRASGPNAREVRKRFTIDKLDIVFVPELGEEDSPLGQLIDQHSDALDELRIAIESSALFYHAIDSHSVLLRDVVAVEFGEGNVVTVFAAGKNPEN